MGCGGVGRSSWKYLIPLVASPKSSPPVENQVLYRPRNTNITQTRFLEIISATILFCAKDDFPEYFKLFVRLPRCAILMLFTMKTLSLVIQFGSTFLQEIISARNHLLKKRAPEIIPPLKRSCARSNFGRRAPNRGPPDESVPKGGERGGDFD